MHIHPYNLTSTHNHTHYHTPPHKKHNHTRKHIFTVTHKHWQHTITFFQYHRSIVPSLHFSVYAPFTSFYNSLYLYSSCSISSLYLILFISIVPSIKLSSRPTRPSLPPSIKYNSLFSISGSLSISFYLLLAHSPSFFLIIFHSLTPPPPNNGFWNFLTQTFQSNGIHP